MATRSLIKKYQLPSHKSNLNPKRDCDGVYRILLDTIPVYWIIKNH